MGAPSTPVLDNFSGTLANWTEFAWNVGDQFQIVSGQCFGQGAGRQSAQGWTAPFATGNLECYFTLGNTIGNGTEAALILASALVDAHRYLIRFQNFQDWDIRRSSDDFTSVAIGSGTQPTAAGDKLAIQKIGSSINAWQYTAGTWTQFASVTDGTYNDMAYIGMYDFDGRNAYDDFGGGTPIISGSGAAGTFPTARIRSRRTSW